MNKTSAERLRQLMLTPAGQEQGRCPTWRERPETRGTPAPALEGGQEGRCPNTERDASAAGTREP